MGLEVVMGSWKLHLKTKILENKNQSQAEGTLKKQHRSY